MKEIYCKKTAHLHGSNKLLPDSLIKTKIQQLLSMPVPQKAEINITLHNMCFIKHWEIYKSVVLILLFVMDPPPQKKNNHNS